MVRVLAAAERVNLRVVRRGHFLADKQAAELIVVDGDLRFIDDGGIHGAAQELDEKIHANGAIQDAPDRNEVSAWDMVLEEAGTGC